MIWFYHWIGLEKLPQIDPSHVEIHPQDPKLQQLSSSGQPNHTIPNQICQKLKFGLKTTYTLYIFLDEVLISYLITAFLKAFRKENNIFSFWGSQSKNDHFGQYVSKSTQFFLRFLFSEENCQSLAKKVMGSRVFYALVTLIFFLLTWGFWAFGTKKILHARFQRVMQSPKRTKIDQMRAKIKWLLFHGLQHFKKVCFLRAQKSRFLTKNATFFDIFGYSHMGFTDFW